MTRAPVLPVERIDPLTLLRRFKIVPDGRERVDVLVADLDPAGHAERSFNRKDFSRWFGDHFTLEPTVVRALASMQLPNEISGHPAQIADHDPLQPPVTQWTPHRGLGVDSILGNQYVRRLHVSLLRLHEPGRSGTVCML